MYEIFKTVLTLSVVGGCITAILLLLKPIASKRAPAKWQYYIWLAVIVCMIVPVWKFIPMENVERTSAQAPAIRTEEILETGALPESAIVEDVPMEYREVAVAPGRSVRIYDLIAYIWFIGMIVFLFLSFGSYAFFLIQKRRTSVEVKENAVFEEVKREFGIRRRIRLRNSPSITSPLLVGIFRPVVYLPCRNIDDASLKMVFRHELTHYRRGDLIYKQCAMIVNAIHWFNPMAYLLSANIAESCEISCDMRVTENMTEADRTFYMQTILDLIEK
ncbi:MAG TPA: M56 family metallopeptidase [Firmicutes bacterium]|nr:M56 family metallopeptidase [Bacillota bacterium]